ncbi:MAG: DUF4124 domain-containing protein, partial [Gammaproteobacteria bacterium]
MGLLEMDYAETMRILLLILSFLLPVSIQADVYRSVDEEGNITFTDKPSPDAERIKIDKIQTIEALKTNPVEAEPVEPEEPEAEGYAKLEITSPENGGSVRDNAGNILFNVALEPALNTG